MPLEQLPDLKVLYQDFRQGLPLTARLLEPRRYVVEGAAGTLYPSVMHGLVSDVIGAQNGMRANAGLWEMGESEKLWCLNRLFFQRTWADAGAPLYFLGHDIGEALLDTEPPGDHPIEEIHWPHPSFRVFLPRNWFFLDNTPILYLDISLVPVADEETHQGMIEEIFDYSSEFCGRPGLVRRWCPERRLMVAAAWDDEALGGGQGGVTIPWDQASLGNLLRVFQESHPVQMPGYIPPDQNQMLLKLGINIVMLLGMVPDEVSESQILRKAKTDREGKIVRDGLWSPKFIGRPQFKTPRPSNPSAEPSGAFHFDEVRKAHWKRQPHGPGKTERKTIWVSLYRTKSRQDRGLGPEL